ncbi:MAG: hypothetical protein V4543_09190 [Bacteroidota bacterium]
MEQPYLHNDHGFWTFVQPAITEKIFDVYYRAADIAGTDPKNAEMLYKAIIEGCGNGHLDAIIQLGALFFETERHIEGNAMMHKAHQVAQQSIPKEFKPGKHKIEWGFMANRPLLRAFHAGGLEYMKEEQYRKALEVFLFLLKVNPNDNQGVRMLLPECYLYLEEYEEVLALGKKFKDDWSADIAFGRVLALYKLNRHDEAKEQFIKAKTDHPNVAAELQKSRHTFPDAQEDYPSFGGGVIIGGRQEAYYYWERHKDFWDKDKELKKFIKAL